LNKVPLYQRADHPIKIVQFGEGNFLRAFVGHAVYQLNQASEFNAGIAVVQPIEVGRVEALEEQGGAYTLFLNGWANERESKETIVIDTIVKTCNPYTDFSDFLTLATLPSLEFIISNTTEAGIVFEPIDAFEDSPQKNFPAKLTRFLWERYQQFNGSASSGLDILPCELINHNADQLKACILKYAAHWNLDAGFNHWINSHNQFHNTLVDRIVPGFPKDDFEKLAAALPYSDHSMVTAEPFFLWVIEGDDRLKEKLPFHLTKLDVKIVPDMQPYRTRKVRILNGAHTAMVPLSILYGLETVSEIFNDDFTDHVLKKVVLDEIVPTLPMDKSEVLAFANAVFDRFKNPFIKHYLSSIALNSISKFKVRVLPSLFAYQEERKETPKYLVFTMACLLEFYKGYWKEQTLPVQDDQEVISFIQQCWELNSINATLDTLMKNTALWGEDLSQNKSLITELEMALTLLQQKGVKEGLTAFVKSNITIEN